MTIRLRALVVALGAYVLANRVRALVVDFSSKFRVSISVKSMSLQVYSQPLLHGGWSSVCA